MNTTQIVEICAMAAHNSNRDYCQTIGDNSQVPWGEAPEWQKASARKGVEGVLRGNTAAESHASWLAEKTRDGWIYGPVKDAARKEHPSMRPFDQLPLAERLKDTLFITAVRAASRALDAVGTVAVVEE